MENADGYVIIGTKLDDSGFEEGIDNLKETTKDVDIDFNMEENTKKGKVLQNILSKITGKVLGISSASAKMILDVGSILVKLGAIGGIIAVVVLSIIAIGKAVKNVLKDNEKFNESIAKIKLLISSIINALGELLAPIVNALVDSINWILDLLVKVLYYVGYLLNAWFGINIFSEKFAKNMTKANGTAKEMKKTLAGFDEMNILSDTTAGGGAGGVSQMPSVDLGSIENIEVPDWLVWIKDSGSEILAILAGVETALVLIKLGLDAITGIGIGLIIAGVVLAIKGLIDFIKDPSWNNFLTILEGISLVVAGIALLMGGWVVAIVAVGVAIVAYIIKNWDKVKEILGKVGSWIYDHLIKPISDFFIGLGNNVKKGISDAIQWITDKFSSMVSFFNTIISKIVSAFKTIGTKVGDAIGTSFKLVINGVLNAIENILNFPIKQINKLLDVINAVPGINISKLTTFNLPRLAKGGIINMPGRGVMVGGAIAGERGTEGVIPLTDSQQMALLGEAIGKYINVNLTNITKLDNRQIAREQKKINAQNDFAFNQ